jgi:hypothetical protein
MMRAAPMLAAGLALALAAVTVAQQPLMIVKSGSVILLATTSDLSSKTSATGDLVPLVTSADILVDGRIAIPKGTAATGQIFGARSTGGLGLSGKLELRALFLRYGGETIRLDGNTGKQGNTSLGTVAGLALVSPVISGRTATLKAGTAVQGVVLRDVVIKAP